MTKQARQATRPRLIISLLILSLVVGGCAETARPKSQPISYEEALLRVNAIAAKHLEIDPSAVRSDLPLSQHSFPAEIKDVRLAVVSIVLDVEEEFGIDIRAEDLGKTKVYNDVATLTSSRLAQLVAERTR